MKWFLDFGPNWLILVHIYHSSVQVIVDELQHNQNGPLNQFSLEMFHVFVGVRGGERSAISFLHPHNGAD